MAPLSPSRFSLSMSAWLGPQLAIWSALAACSGPRARPADAGQGVDASPVDAGSPTVDAPAAPCGSGKLVVDRTSCPGEIVTPPSALLAAMPELGDVISMDGLDEGALPCLPVYVCAPADAATIVFSDSPESPSSDGVLYADTLGPGHVRFYVYHVDADSNPRKFPIVALNSGTADAHVTITREGLAAPSSDYIDLGKAVAAAWNASSEATVVTVPAGTRVVLDAALDAEHATTNQLVHAIVDVYTDAPVKFSIVSVLASEDAATLTASLPLLPKDADHDRGTFANADLTLLATGHDTAPSARHLRLGDGTTEPELTGSDATTGSAATLHGNYGVVYNVVSPLSFLASPRGGAWAGAWNMDGIPTASGGLSTTTDAIWLAATPSFTLISGGGSSLPVDLVALQH